MAFQVSNKAFDDIFNSTEEEIVKKVPEGIVSDFLSGLKDYLKENSRYPASKVMANWIEKGGSISSFSCRADLVDPLVEEFRQSQIPFVLIKEMSGEQGFLIRSKDNDAQRKIVRKLLKKKSEYCKITTGKLATEEYLRRRIPDKKMIGIGDISSEQLVYLEELCNKYLPGETVGVDRMEDGTYLLTVHGQTAVMGIPGSPSANFVKALTETLFLFNASTKKEFVNASKETNVFRREKAKGFPDRQGTLQQPTWVVGDGNRFVKRTVRGFELGHAEEIGDQIFLEQDLKVSFDDERFTQKMNSGLSRIMNKKVLYTLQDVMDHFKTKRNQPQNVQVYGEKHFIEEVNNIVSHKVRRDAIYVRGNDWVSKLKHYQSEAGKVVSSAKDGKVPPGYKKEDIVELMDIAHRYRFNLGIATPAIEKMMNVEVYDRSASSQKVKDVVKEIAKHRANIEISTPVPGQERASREDGR